MLPTPGDRPAQLCHSPQEIHKKKNVSTQSQLCAGNKHLVAHGAVGRANASQVLRVYLGLVTMNPCQNMHA